MILFVVLMFATFIVGPTLFLVLLGTQAFGGMVADFVSMSLFTGAGPMGAGDGSATGWINAWTVFYWAWALSWSPFAGLFIARISKGRTVREVAFTGIVATSGATIPWFTFVGGTAVWAQHNGIADFSAVIAGNAGPEVSGFILFEALNFTLNLGGIDDDPDRVRTDLRVHDPRDDVLRHVGGLLDAGRLDDDHRRKGQTVEHQPHLLGRRPRVDRSDPDDPRR